MSKNQSLPEFRSSLTDKYKGLLQDGNGTQFHPGFGRCWRVSVDLFRWTNADFYDILLVIIFFE